MSKYRFKTKEEFKRDGLWTKDHPDKWTTSGSMNKYLGQDIPDSYNITCDKQEKLYYETWTFRNCDYVLKEESFVLPSNWCVKVDRNCQPEEVYKWRQCCWIDAGYINNSTIWTGVVLDNYTEITLEQFKQHVLKESPVVESPKEENYVGRTIKALVKSPQGTGVQLGEEIKILIKENKDTYILERTARDFSNMRINIPLDLSDWELLPESPKEIDMKDIQEEAKKRFPIGCKFIPIDYITTYTLIEDDCTYKIKDKYIFAHNRHGYLYINGKWATLVSSPETTKEMFHEGDYIVTLDVDGGYYNCARKNYCFKQRITNKGIYPTVDLQGSIDNGHNVMSFGKKEYLKDWRYATPEEAAEYERIGKPYDVTTLQKKEESIPEYVECIEVPRGWSITKKGVIYKIDSFDSVTGYFRLIFNKGKGGQRVTSEKNCFKPSTKEAYEAQNTPKEESTPEYVECIRSDESGFTVDKIYNWPTPVDDRGKKRDIDILDGSLWVFKPSTKEAYEAQFVSKELTKEDLVEGEIYFYNNQHTIVYPSGPAFYDGKYESNVNLMWFLPTTHATEEQKALLRSYMKKDEKQEWSEGTYAVGVKGNFGVYEGSTNPISVGRIFTVREDLRKDSISTKESSYWVYKENLRWFATYLEALDFSNQLIASPSPTESINSIVEERISIPSIKKETFIENVQSVDVEIYRKKKIRIF
jgi:hypothetical protein